MKKLLLVLLACVYSINADAQLFKKIYDNVFKYSSVYAAGNTSNSFETPRKDYFVRPPEDGNLYDIPQVIDDTEYFPNDYRLGLGIRKLARFGYENKPNFYNGTENNIALSAPTAAVQGLEYLFHYEKERQRGDEFENSRYFIRHTGKYHIIKAEQRQAERLGYRERRNISDFKAKRGPFGIGSLIAGLLGFINPALGLAYRGITSIPGVVGKFKSSNTLADFFGSLRGPKNITDDDDDTTLLDQVDPNLPFAQSYLNQIKSQLPSTVNQPTGIVNTDAFNNMNLANMTVEELNQIAGGP